MPPPDTATHSPPTPADRAQTLAEHLDELRRRVGWSLAALLVAVLAAWTQADRILAWLQRPLAPYVPRVAVFSPTEPLLAYLRVSAFAGLVLAMPVILWHVWGFVRSGLTPRERWWGAGFVGWGSAQFLAGAAAAYWLFLPTGLRVLLGIGREVFEPVISVDRYLSFVTTLVIWTGLIFELPVVVVLLARAGILTPPWLRQSRPYAILVLMILAAIVTPTTDPVNLLLLAVPMIGLYELSIVLAGIVARRPSSRDDE